MALEITHFVEFQPRTGLNGATGRPDAVQDSHTGNWLHPEDPAFAAIAKAVGDRAFVGFAEVSPLGVKVEQNGGCVF